MLILLSLILAIIYLYKSGKLDWILFKINKNKLLKSASNDPEIIKVLIYALNEFGMKNKLNFSNILITFDTKLDTNKLECTIYSWINDNYEKFPHQFIFIKNKIKNENKNKNIINLKSDSENVDLSDLDNEYKIIVKINVWNATLGYKIFKRQTE